MTGRWTATGTHQGALMGIPPTGKPVMLTGITGYRFADGKMVEQWWSLDALGMFQQLGIIPTPGGNPWVKQTDMPTARGALSTSAVDGIIYAIGGGAGPFSNYATVEAYAPATGAWTTKAAMPTARANLSTCVVNSVIYAIGGGWAPVLATVEAYDPATDTWTTKAPLPTPRAMLSTSVVDGIIYAIGGFDDSMAGLAKVEAYDPKTDTWTEKADMPTARMALSTGVVDSIIYAIGGGESIQGASLPTVEAYDPATDAWTAKVDMPAPRAGLSAGVIDTIIYSFGGTTVGGGAALSTVQAYDPVTETWITRADMPTPRKFLSSSVMDGKIYVCGGADSQGQALATVEIYNPVADPITGVEEVSGATAIPSGYALSQNYPNPFNPSTTIRYKLPGAAYITLTVYDLLGREVKVLVNEQKPAGAYNVRFDAAGLTSGVYFYKIHARPANGRQDGEYVETRKLILLR